MGFVWVDFFVFDDGIYINEINMMFGFIDISMYLKFWEVLGFGYSVLIDVLIVFGLEWYEDC